MFRITIGKNLARFFVFLLVFALPLGVFAFNIPLRPDNYISDYAGVLSSSQKESINSLLREYEADTSNQIFAAVFSSLEGESLEDLSIRIAEKWQPGHKGKDNGVLILVFLKERKVRIEVGYGLEPLLTDVKSKLIIQNLIAPNFRNGDYYRGILAGVLGVIKTLSPDFTPKQTKVYQPSGIGRGGNPIFSLLIMLLLVFFIIRHPFLALFLFSSGFSSRGGYSGGSFGGDGGFNGGFGGGFGGGGASGDW